MDTLSNAFEKRFNITIVLSSDTESDGDESKQSATDTEYGGEESKQSAKIPSSLPVSNVIVPAAAKSSNVQLNNTFLLKTNTVSRLLKLQHHQRAVNHLKQITNISVYCISLMVVVLSLRKKRKRVEKIKS